MASDINLSSVGRVPDVARTQRVQEIRADTGQHSLRASFQEEAGKPMKEVRPSPKPQDAEIPKDRGNRNPSDQGGSETGKRGKGPEDPDDAGRILDVLC